MGDASLVLQQKCNLSCFVKGEVYNGLVTGNSDQACFHLHTQQLCKAFAEVLFTQCVYGAAF